jgi:DNA modification methylase
VTPTIDLRVGDVIERLRHRPSRSVDCVVTSPPYFGLRDYGTGEWSGGDPDCDHLKPTTTMNVGFNERWGQGAGERKQETKNAGQYREVCVKCGALRIDKQIGLEATREEYIERIVQVFREIRRVLTDHGTVWLNLGDSYVSVGSGLQGADGQMASRRVAQVRDSKAVHGEVQRPPSVDGLAAKQLIGIPWRVAFALQDDGWWLRSDIIWSKTNPMPESITDRPTKSHEYLFLLTKRSRYYFDQEAVREPAEWARWGDQTNGKHEGGESAASWIGAKSKSELQARATPSWEERKAAGATRGNLAANGNVGAGTQRSVHGEGLSHDLGDASRGRNIRTVWTIPTQPYAEAHFATYPTALVEPCVKAGCPVRVCKTCGMPSERIVEVSKTFESGSGQSGRLPIGKQDLLAGEGNSTPDIRMGPVLETRTVGWTDCGHDDWRLGVVLDPFAGSGTTLLVARRLGRSSMGIELNPEYAELARRRLATWWRDPPRLRSEPVDGQLALEIAALAPLSDHSA